jgi:type II secretory pathway pseudopilin PulG
MKRLANLVRVDDRGLTLVELLVATAMTIIITGAAVALMVSALHKQQNVTSRSDRIGEARNAIEKITNDIRQGRKVTVAGPTGVTIETYCDSSSGLGEKCTVAYACATETTGKYKCTRTVGTTTTTPIIELSSPNVFCFVPSTVSGNESECGTRKTGAEPTYVGVEVKLASREGGGATLQDGAALHNFGL